jgi:peptidoglycan/xylan/chitin deacetylase (PgdA/CDA1 family)
VAGEAALTFDDGPGDATPAVLDILERYRIPATFFVVGRAVSGHRSLLARMRDDGDTVENHTWDHPHLTKLSAGAVATQLARTNAAISAAIGVAPACFRPPYLDTDSAVVSGAAALHLHQVLANVNPGDYSRPDPAVIAQRILSVAHGQAVVVGLHDGGDDRSRTVAALPVVIDGLTAAGYHFVSLCARRRPRLYRRCDHLEVSGPIRRQLRSSRRDELPPRPDPCGRPGQPEGRCCGSP